MAVAQEAADIEPQGQGQEHRRDQRRARCSTAGRHLDLLGLEGRLFRHRGRRAQPSTTRCATCWPSRWARPTARNGSTPACTGPMASTARARVTSMSITRPASSSARPTPMSGRSPMPASSSRSTTIWSTKAGSWTCGCARRACSNTARAPAPISPTLRGENEKLSGGGKSSGLMSFLKIGDRAAGAIKSGGTTRRAAKMVVVNVDHPDIENFIDWKVIEEQKVAAMVDRLEARQQAPQRDHGRMPRLGRRRRRQSALRSQDQQGPEKGDPGRARGADSRKLRPARRPVRAPGLHRDQVPDPRHRLGFGSLSHRLGPELEQLGTRHQRVPAEGARRRRLAARAPHRRQGRQDREGRASSGNRSPKPPGPAPIRACSTTPPSTSGTPARNRGRSTPRTHARNTCSSTIPPATWPRSTCSPSARPTALSTWTASATRCGCGPWCWKSRC